MTRDLLIRMERGHVRAWPALETRDVEGWLWRCSGGGSQRANSVSTVDFTGTDPEAAIDLVEALYRGKSAPARFHTFDATAPAGLDERLRARGYRESEATLTMVKPAAATVAPPDTERHDQADADWRGVYLEEISESRRAVADRILTSIPGPRAFFACRRGGRVISTASAVIGFGCAVVECVATRGDCRRQGGAEATLHALETWVATQDATMLGLQVVATNTPAIALYARLGYAVAGRNRFWVRDI